MKLPKHTGVAAASVLLGVTASVALGAGWQRASEPAPEPAPTVTVSTAPIVQSLDDTDTTDTLPRCVEDDYNEGADWCYTVRVTDNQPILLAPHDGGAYTISDTQAKLPACGDGPGYWCQGTDAYGDYILSPDDVQYHAG